jgi:hypothetical protein
LYTERDLTPSVCIIAADSSHVKKVFWLLSSSALIMPPISLLCVDG